MSLRFRHYAPFPTVDSPLLCWKSMENVLERDVLGTTSTHISLMFRHTSPAWSFTLAFSKGGEIVPWGDNVWIPDSWLWRNVLLGIPALINFSTWNDWKSTAIENAEVKSALRLFKCTEICPRDTRAARRTCWTDIQLQSDIWCLLPPRLWHAMDALHLSCRRLNIFIVICMFMLFDCLWNVRFFLVLYSLTFLWKNVTGSVFVKMCCNQLNFWC